MTDDLGGGTTINFITYKNRRHIPTILGIE